MYTSGFFRASEKTKSTVEKLWKIERAFLRFFFYVIRQFFTVSILLFTETNILRFEFGALKGFALLQMCVSFIVIGFQSVNELWVRYCISSAFPESGKALRGFHYARFIAKCHNSVHFLCTHLYKIKYKCKVNYMYTHINYNI